MVCAVQYQYVWKLKMQGVNGDAKEDKYGIRIYIILNEWEICIYMTVKKYEMLLDNAYGMCITYEYRYDLRKWRSKWNGK